MGDQFLGEIRMVGFNFPPNGWALCDGSLLPISQYSALFALLGTTFGGNGVSTFGLPDLRGRSPVGMGNGIGLSPITQGEMAGTENVNILSTQMPAHTHVATATTTASFSVAGTASNQQITPSATNSVLGASGTGGPSAAAIWSDKITTPVVLTNPNTVTTTVTNAVVGNGLPLPIRNPFLGTNFIIALNGIFPSRN